MPNTILLNPALVEGKTRKKNIQTLVVSMGAAAASQPEIEIPNYGDVTHLEYVLTQSTTGTLTTPNPVDRAISLIALKDKIGNSIFSYIRGRDLPILDRFLNTGINRVPPDSSNSAQTHRFLVPINIEQKDMPARVQVTIAPYSAMAASGATGGSVTLDVIAWYQDKTKFENTIRFSRLTQAIVSGSNNFASTLPRNKNILHLLFSVGTESNITDITLSENGNAELQAMRPTDLIGVDSVKLRDGHVTGQFSLYNSPFFVGDKTILEVNGAGSDTIEWYLVIAD